MQAAWLCASVLGWIAEPLAHNTGMPLRMLRQPALQSITHQMALQMKPSTAPPLVGPVSHASVAEGAREERVGVLLLNLGGPDTLDQVEPFLYNLFSDPEILTYATLTSSTHIFPSLKPTLLPRHPHCDARAPPRRHFGTVCW